MLNINKAFTQPLKEKDGMVKVLAYFGLAVIFGVFSFLSQIPAELFKDGTGKPSSAFLVVTLVLSCVSFIASMIFGLIQAWYQYEYAQAAMQERVSHAPWKVRFGESLKKALKLFLVEFIYAIPMIVLVVCGYFTVIFGVLAAISGGQYGSRGLASNYGVNSPEYLQAMFANVGLPTLIVICCILFVMVLVGVAYNNFIVTPARLRLIETNTFSRAFDIGKILRSVKHNSRAYTQLFAIQLALAIIFTVAAIVSAVMIFILIGICLIFFLYVVALYYQAFVYPTLAGDMYRQLKK